jgi:hypothetical protein
MRWDYDSIAGAFIMAPSQLSNSLLVLISRIFWMAVGPVTLALLAFTIINKGGGWFTPTDFVFLAVLAVLLLARWIEFLGGDPHTSTGEPATPDDLRRYVLYAIILGLGAWIVANLIGNHLLAS